jgi:polar amino acid transport system substrate-binding protein
LTIFDNMSIASFFDRGWGCAISGKRPSPFFSKPASVRRVDRRLAALAADAKIRVPAGGVQNKVGSLTISGSSFMPREVVSELAPTGVLRAAINMGNFLLVTGKTPSGDPEGVSPDMAREIAARLGVPVKYVPYARPGEIADDAEKGLWDIGLIGAEPQRAAVISFTAAYCEIEATYLVPAGSPIRNVAEVDQPGKRIAVTARSAYGLWLENNVKKAQLVQFDSADAALKQFDGEKMDAYAGLRPGLLAVAQARPGSRILDGQFTAVQQAVGTARKNTAGAAFLRDFVEEAKKSGLVARLIERHGVVGRLSVAPAA